MMIEQRSPRIEDEAYLAWVRTQRCVICGTDQNIEAAHLRVGSINDGKPIIGMQMKSSDRWALPLCTKHHREQHANGDELLWWASKGILDVFVLSIAYQHDYAEEAE